MSSTHAARSEIEVDWPALEATVAALEEVGEQWSTTIAYAVAWMADPSGFAPSPVCLLRPLGEAMELVGEALQAAGRWWTEDWGRVRDGVVLTTRELGASDGRAQHLADALGRSGALELADEVPFAVPAQAA